MEHLLNDLKEKLIIRKNNEMNKIKNLETESNKESLLISTGKIIELEHMITLLDNMANYDNQSKKQTV